MKLIQALIIIIVGLTPLNSFSKVVLKCDQIQGKWAPIYINCHKVEDSNALKSKTTTIIQPIYFTPQEVMYKNISYGSFPTQEIQKMSTPENIDYKTLRSPASVEQSDTE